MSTTRDYQVFRMPDGAQLYVWKQPPGDQQSGVEHAILVKDGTGTVLTSWGLATVSDVVDLVECSIGDDEPHS